MLHKINAYLSLHIFAYFGGKSVKRDSNMENMKKMGENVFLDFLEIPDVSMRGEGFQDCVALLWNPSVLGHLFLSLSVLTSTKRVFSATVPAQNHGLHTYILDVLWGFSRWQNKKVANNTCINNMIYIKLLMNSEACCKLDCFNCGIVALL